MNQDRHLPGRKQKRRATQAQQRRELIDPAVEPTGDKIHRLARAGLSTIPIAGTAAVEIFNTIVTPPLEKRRTQWMLAIEEELQRIVTNGNRSIEDLVNDESFVSTLLQASNAAIRTHQTEKLLALRNAVVNSAAADAPDENLQAVFVSLVDSLMPWHLKLLTLCSRSPLGIRKPSAGVRKQEAGGRMRTVSNHVYPKSDEVEAAFPELRGKSELYMFLIADLEQKGLVERAENLEIPGNDQIRTTAIGRVFLEFITANE